jgi:hypothetical protein
MNDVYTSDCMIGHDMFVVDAMTDDHKILDVWSTSLAAPPDDDINDYELISVET